jgi:hypothetical protein
MQGNDHAANDSHEEQGIGSLNDADQGGKPFKKIRPDAHQEEHHDRKNPKQGILFHQSVLPDQLKNGNENTDAQDGCHPLNTSHKNLPICEPVL